MRSQRSTNLRQKTPKISILDLDFEAINVKTYPVKLYNFSPLYYYVWKKAFERSFHMPYDLISCQISFVLSYFIALSNIILCYLALLHFHFSLLYCNRLDDCFIEFLVKASKPTFTFLFLTFSNAF